MGMTFATTSHVSVALPEKDQAIAAIRDNAQCELLERATCSGTDGRGAHKGHVLLLHMLLGGMIRSEARRS